MANQLLRKAWEAITKPCSLRSLRFVIQSYVRYNPTLPEKQVLLRPSDGLVLPLKEQTFLEARLPLEEPDRVDFTSRNQTADVDKVTRFQ